MFFNFNRFEGDNYALMRRYFADILISDIEEYTSLGKKKVVDVGGATGEFCKVLNEKRGCDAVNVDPQPGAFVWPRTIRGNADALPFTAGEFDIVISRGVLEHVPSERQQASVNEMSRVMRKGGTCYIVIPPWYNPHAGHELKPFHYFPFAIAKALRDLFFKKRVWGGSYEEHQLFPITFAKMRKMIEGSGMRLLGTKDTHLRMHFLTKIPVLREVSVPAVAFIATKPAWSRSSSGRYAHNGERI